MRFNTTKRLLKAGKPAIGAWLNFPCVNVAEVMAHAGWDWVTVDAEHGPMTIEMLNNMFTAIGTTAAMPLCRIPDNDPVWIKRILDAGAMGIVVPMVCTAEEAAKAVSYAKYPPAGVRSAGGGRWRYWAGADYPKYADDEILVVVMIEHITAVEHVEEILAVPGVDACFIGPNDLAWSMGLGKGPGASDPSHAEAVARVLAAAKKLGVPAGIHCRSVEEVPMRAEQGFQFLACTSDHFMLFNTASQGASYIREKIGRPSVGE
ncbi:MAG: aldolase/citrate lyase family protein [candidate division NC10 bacterium]